MPFKEPWLPLQDIVDAITMIGRFTTGLDLDAFKADPKTVAAVERKLLLISEAAVRLGEHGGYFVPWLALAQYSRDRQLASASVRRC